MNKLLVSALLATSLIASQSAQAATSVVNLPLVIINQSTVNFSGYNGQPKDVTGEQKKGYFGSLFANVAGTFYATYLGNESGYVNSYTLSVGGASLYETNPLGTTVSSKVGPGLVGFSFKDSHGATFSNGMTQTTYLGFAILPGTTKTRGTFDYVLGFNDSATVDADYDDFVVGVKFIATPVPEAETYSMMLLGLGLMGFIARRRRSNQA